MFVVLKLEPPFFSVVIGFWECCRCQLAGESEMLSFPNMSPITHVRNTMSLRVTQSHSNSLDCLAHTLDSCFPLGPLGTCHLLLCIGSFTFMSFFC